MPNIMDDVNSWDTILLGFGLSQRSTDRFMEDYNTPRDLMVSSVKQIKEVISQQNKIYREHSTANRRCYINAAQMNRIVAFHYWTTYAVKEAHALYDTTETPKFDRAWIDSISDNYSMKGLEPTSQSTTFSVVIPPFEGTNWYEVKAHIASLLATRIGMSGIPLSYLIRDTRQEWKDTEHIVSLQTRRTATKLHSGSSFDLDNGELYRILSNVFSSTTLEDVIRAQQKSQNGVTAWKKITDNVEGANYHSELKRQGDAVIENAFFDPTKNFSFERYFQAHVKSHEIHAAALDPVPEWRKINGFMKGVKCTQLQDDYRNIKDDTRFQNFTAFYNKMNENYRMLVEQKIIKPVSIFKRKISQLGTETDTTSGRGRGGRGGRNGGRGRGRFNGRGRGGRGRQTGRNSGRGRGRGYDRGQHGSYQADLSCLPNDIDHNNLTFTDERWYNEFTYEQRAAITALRASRNQNRNLNYVQRNYDDASSMGNSIRHVYEVNIPQPSNSLPPVPSIIPQAPPNQSQNTNASTNSTNAGSAFGRRS